MNAGTARVLEALRASPAEPLSGAALSDELGVTRAQVWKHVETLRARGYRIEGAPGGGYRLLAAPDRLYPEELAPRLRTRWLARDYHYLLETDSTNRVAFELGTAGAPHGATVVAEAQTAGRGRLGRAFFSPPALNLYTSILLRPSLALAEAPPLVLAAGVAVAETVASCLPRPEAVGIKWPNDVQIDGRKVCGILMELQAEAARVAFVVLGIGVNLNVHPGDFPEEFRSLATSLAAARGQPVDRLDFAARLFGTLEGVLDGFAAGGFEHIRPRFEARFALSGRRVRVAQTAGRETTGWVLGVDPDGALRLRGPNGTEQRVVAGDVTLAREETTA